MYFSIFVLRVNIEDIIRFNESTKDASIAKSAAQSRSVLFTEIIFNTWRHANRRPTTRDAAIHNHKLRPLYVFEEEYN